MYAIKFSVKQLFKLLNEIWQKSRLRKNSPMAIANQTSGGKRNERSLHSLAPARQVLNQGSVRSDEISVKTNLTENPLFVVRNYEKVKLGYQGMDWLIEDLIQCGSVNFVFGPTSSKKSLFCLDLAHSVATGRSFFGCTLKQSKVLYLCLEGHQGFDGRYVATNEEYGTTDQLLLVHQTEPLNLTNKDHVSKLLVAGQQAKLIIVDTLNEASHGLDENLASFGPALVAHFRNYLSEGGTIIFVHHTGKGDTEQMRGSSSLLARADTAIALRAHGDEYSTWKVAKMRDGFWDKEKGFKIVKKSAVFGNGKKNVTAVIQPVELDEVPRTRGSKSTDQFPKGDNIELLLPVIKQLCIQHGGSVEESILIQACISTLKEKDAATSKKPREDKVLRQRTKEVLTTLKETNNIEQSEGKIGLIL